MIYFRKGTLIPEYIPAPGSGTLILQNWPMYAWLDSRGVVVHRKLIYSFTNKYIVDYNCYQYPHNSLQITCKVADHICIGNGQA